MTSIDSTAIPGHLAEECLHAWVEKGETYVSKLSSPKIVLMTSYTTSSSAIPAASISGRTITFDLGKSTGLNILIKGKL